MTALRKWRELLPIHPAAELFPLMPPGELDTIEQVLAAEPAEVAAE
jgi:hypothetical protein